MENFDWIVYLSFYLLIIFVCYFVVKRLFKKFSSEIAYDLQNVAYNLKSDVTSSVEELLKQSQLNLFESKDKLATTNKNLLEEILKPFKEDINKFQQQSNDIHTKQTEQVSKLQGRLEVMLQMQNKLTVETDKLTNALRGNVKLQGNLGESILRRVLESCGLSNYICCSEQVTYSTEDGKKQPDFIINLPENKQIIIDSKMSLNSYVDYSNAENEIDKKILINDIKRSFDNHINKLAKKKYDTINGLNTTHAVFLFIPIESIYLILAENFPDIFMKASKHKIYIVTTMSLMPLLQIIEHIWKVHEQDKNTKAMADIAGKIYDKFESVLCEFDNIRNGVHKLENQLNVLEKKFIGKDNLVKNIQKLKQLGANTNKNMSETWLDKANAVIEGAKSN